MDYLRIIEILIERLGNVSLEQAKTWAEVEENAQSLKEEAERAIADEKK